MVLPVTTLEPSADFAPGSDLCSLFFATARHQADRTALVEGPRRVTFGALAERVGRAANAFGRAGIGRGDRVAILSKNSIEYIELFFGTLAAGGCVVPLPTMATPEQLRLMVLDSRVRVLAVAESLRHLADPFVDGMALRRPMGIDFADARWAPYEEFLRDAPSSPTAVTIGPRDDFNIIYSSGTTGTPKGIVHSHATRLEFTRGCAAFGFGPRAVNIVSTPLYSNTTMVAWLPSMTFGATNVLMDKFDARRFVELCQAERVTHAMLVPVQYERILRLEDLARFDLSSLQLKISTSAPLRASVKREILDRMPGLLIEIYGLTEGGVATILIASAQPDKLESVGQAMGGCELRIVDEEGTELPAGAVGEVVGRSSIMMKGYENRPDDTARLLWRDRQGRTFLRSGDLGKLDDEGFLYLVGRKKDMIISGGLNIYPADLEACLLQHPSVGEAAVIGVPSHEWGETPLALVVLRGGMFESAEALRTWANERLAKSQRIARVEIRDALPKSAIGKVLKRELREQYSRG
jgi:acyl-CoA synthetase (AMP-forming)/AMP-acid ligase II